jgi:DNA polymerase-3 subunit epsilon
VKRHGGSLLEKVVDRLGDGPTHTVTLARDVLGLEGHAGAASAAVFALLGNDPRFSVDAGGTWTLLHDVGEDLIDHLDFAVVDVETTGGKAGNGDRITEIAIVEVADGVIVDEFATLVNPGRTIPPMITSLTGIDGGMVADAPFFEHVVPEVEARLEGRIFVAHNAAFDRRFVHHELAAAGSDMDLGSPLCTVQLARGLLPRLRRRNLDALARHYGVPIHGRHRALGDAMATARILLRLLDEAANLGIRDLDTLRRHVKRRARRRGRPVRRAVGDGSARDDE